MNTVAMVVDVTEFPRANPEVLVKIIVFPQEIDRGTLTRTAVLL